MSFLINCDNRKCLKIQAALLDTINNIVICAECNNEIKNVTYFAKAQLKSLGQTCKNIKTKQSYAVKCSHCEMENMPIIKDDQFLCTNCKKELTNLSVPFKLILKDAIRNANK